MNLNHSLIVAAAVAVPTFIASAQPVQWRVEDGGNGHWYEVISGIRNIRGTVAETMANRRGGYLVTFGSAAETTFVVSLVTSSSAGLSPLGPWIGLKQNQHSPMYSEPGGGWEWVDGTTAPIDWHPVAPNNDCFGVAEDWANMTFDGRINDLGEDPACVGSWPNGAINSFVIEWSADCNTDGIVDYGQILSGELPDTDNNGVPDGPVIATQPTDQAVGVDVPVSFFVEMTAVAGCTDPISYQWQRRDPLVSDPNAANAWIDLTDGGGFVNTRTSALLITRPTPGLATGYRCKIGGGCGCDTSNGRFIYTNEVNFSVACPADFNADGGVDFQDVEAFFLRWENGC